MYINLVKHKYINLLKCSEAEKTRTRKEDSKII